MKLSLRLASLLPCAVLLSSGCIIVDDTDDDAATTAPATGGQTTSDTSGQTTSGTGEPMTSDTSGAASTSGGLDESGSSGAAIDCSRCDAEVQPDVLCHSEYDAALDVCACDEGFIFESSDPAGESNFECVEGGCGSDPNNEVDAAGQCVCAEGWTFCTSDLDDFSCCED